MNTKDCPRGPLEPVVSCAAPEFDGPLTHGMELARTGTDGIERVVGVFRNEGGNFAVAIVTMWDAENPTVTRVALSPDGIELLAAALIAAMDRMEEFPIPAKPDNAS